MSNIVFNGEKEELIERFLCAYQLINKIKNWWIVNFEMAINENFDNINIEEIDIENIQSGKKLMIDMALSVLAANEELLSVYKNTKKDN